MKKIIAVCALGLFLTAGLVGCSSSTTSAPAAATTPKGPAKDPVKDPVKGETK